MSVDGINSLIMNILGFAAFGFLIIIVGWAIYYIGSCALIGFAIFMLMFLIYMLSKSIMGIFSFLGMLLGGIIFIGKWLLIIGVFIVVGAIIVGLIREAYEKFSE